MQNMWNLHYLRRMDFRCIPILLCLMAISLTVISTATCFNASGGEEIFFTRDVQKQLKRFVMGMMVFFGFSLFDYRRLREWAWITYAVSILLLIGVFFTTPIVSVHRWYRIPFLHVMIQPAEYVKLAVVLTLSWFLERKAKRCSHLSTCLQGILILGIPFILILKQPDLGSALLLFPIGLSMFYFGGMKGKILQLLTLLSGTLLAVVLAIFLGWIPDHVARPFATTFLKEYQYERLHPNTHHQNAAKTAIALGGVWGRGWKNGQFTKRQFLPAARTDSVFPAFVEEFGLIGTIILLSLFFSLIYCSFRVTVVARDLFGRVLAGGISTYLAVHVIVNIGMMCGLFPITGVPLILLSYGGSSVMLTMSALGILQSIYTRRFMF